jgi:hypothetical protein
VKLWSFATMGPDDMALDIDTEIGYITEDESNNGSEDDSDDSMYIRISQFFFKSFVTSVTPLNRPLRSPNLFD